MNEKEQVTKREMLKWLDNLFDCGEWGWSKAEERLFQAIRIRIENTPRVTRGDKFIRHIKAHLSPGLDVICKICGKTVDEIYNSPDINPDEQTEGG